MRDVNKVTLIGRISTDISTADLNEWKTKVVNFSVATNRSFKNSKWEKVDEAEFTRCVAFWKLAEIISTKLKKSSKVYVEGRLRTRSYEDKEGVKRYVTEVVVNDVTFC